MAILGLISLSTWLMFDFSVWGSLQNFAQPLQRMCGWQFDSQLLTRIGGAMVCGQELPTGELRTLFLQLGIYHVLVVSGAHLVFLSQVLSSWQEAVPARAKIIAPLLIVFCLMTGLQAPVLRAGLQMFFRWQRHRQPLQNLFLSYVACLVIHPPWITSVSLHLSFLAAIGIGLPFNFWWKSLAIVALTLPLILGFGTFNGSGSLMGVVLSPLIEILFFPICLLAWLLPFLQPAVDFVLQFALGLLESLRPLTGVPLRWSWGITGWAVPVYTMMVFTSLQLLMRPSSVPMDARSAC